MPAITSARFSLSASRAGLGVGGGLRQRVDRGALRLALALLDRVGMDRDEQRRLPDARHADPVHQRNEGVVGARHHHAVFAGPFELVAKLQRRIPARCPFPSRRCARPRRCRCRRGRDRARRSAADRPCARARAPARRWSTARSRPVFGRERLHEAVAVGRGEIDHQPRRLARRGIDHEGLVDPHRLADIHHDARAALHDEAEAERLDQAAAGFAGLGRQVEGHLRQVDHHAIGIGEREGPQIDLLREVHDEAGLGVVAADPGVGRHRIGRRWRARARPRSADEAIPAPVSSSKHARIVRSVARSATNPEPPRPSYSIRSGWLIGT